MIKNECNIDSAFEDKQARLNGRPVDVSAGANFSLDLTFRDGEARIYAYAVDSAGNSSQFTRNFLVNAHPPAVRRVKPAHGATSVPLDKFVQISFNENIDLETVDEQSIYLTNSDGNVIPSYWSFVPDSERVVLLHPRDDYPGSEKITVNIKTMITDQFGEPMAQEFNSAFTTREAPTSIRGVVFSSELTPLRGVEVSIQGTDYKTKTNAFGDFILEDVDVAGVAVLDIDGSAYKPQGDDPDPPSYGMLHQRVMVARGEMNDIRPERPFIMTPIDQKSATFIPADQAITADFNNRIPGLEMEIPAGAAIFPDGTKEGTITATKVDPQMAPAALPDGGIPPIYVQLEPDGLEFSGPVPVEIALGPAAGYTAGQEFTFASYGADGTYDVIGSGHAEAVLSHKLDCKDQPRKLL